MKRDMYKTVAGIKGKIPHACAMSFGECADLTKKAAEGKAFEAIATAFDYGFVLGQRCAKKNPGTKTGARVTAGQSFQA